jgi:hypothetical protein
MADPQEIGNNQTISHRKKERLGVDDDSEDDDLATWAENVRIWERYGIEVLQKVETDRAIAILPKSVDQQTLRFAAERPVLTFTKRS